MLKRAIALGVASLAIAGPSLSADGDGEFAIKGAGQKSCESFLAALDDRSGDVGLYAGWIEGYVTGFNQFRDGTFDLMAWQTTETVVLLMKSVCSQLSSDTRFIDAFYELVRRSKAASLSEHSDASILSNDGKSTIIYRDILALAKERLAAAGYDISSESEDFGPAEIAIFSDYQEANGLPVTGLPDQQTLFQLFLRQ